MHALAHGLIHTSRTSNSISQQKLCYDAPEHLHMVQKLGKFSVVICISIQSA